MVGPAPTYFPESTKRSPQQGLPLSFRDIDTTLDQLSASPSSTPSTTFSFQYTHLEVNAMIWQFPTSPNDNADDDSGTLSILVDPIATQLDFGIAPLYRANKKVLSPDDTYRLIDEAAPTHVLLSQGLDDHTHLPTLRELVRRHPSLHYILPPSAQDIVRGIIPKEKITVLRHGETFAFNDKASVTATVGSLVGPPWQARENGYLLKITTPSSLQPFTLYYEPHGDTTPDMLVLPKDSKNGNARQPIRADVCILPVTQQSLPAQLPTALQFPLVHGPQRMYEIVQALGASKVIPLCNGDLATDGVLAQLVASSGSLDEFAQRLGQPPKGVSKVTMERPIPGEPLTVQLTK